MHSNLCTMEIPSNGSYRYFITFIADFRGKVWVYFLKQKSNACDNFKIFKTFVERQSDCHIKNLRTDRGKKYLVCDDFFEENKIQH